MRILVSAVVTATLLTGCASVGYRAVPEPVESQTVRYELGAPTVSDHGNSISVTIVPVGAGPDRRLVFDVAVINRSEESANFGVENLALTVDGVPVGFYTHEELVAEAEARRNAQVVAAIIIGAAAAYSAAQNAHTTNYGYISSPYDYTTFSYTQYHPEVAIAGGLMAGALTGASIVAANQTMEETLAGLGYASLRMSTVDPGYSFGGRAIARRVEVAEDQVAHAALNVTFAGESMDFYFAVEQGVGVAPRYSSAPRAGVEAAGKPQG